MSDMAALTAWRRRALDGGGRRAPRPPRSVLGAVGVALACAVGGGRALDAGSTPSRSSPPTVDQAGGPALACAPVAAALHADIDGDGCDEQVSFADGTLTAGGMRLRVGAPGDQVALGRWTCGPVTVALLRPATGEVFRFDGWASQANAVPAVPLGRVEGAVGLGAAARGGGRCDDLVVTRSSGPPVLLPERPVAG